METLKHGIIEISKSTERERLELVEKKVEIQKKRVEIKKEKQNIDEMIFRRNISIEEQKVLIDKISELRNVLTSVTVDDERTIMASELFLTPTIAGERREAVIRKLMELIKRI
jgi:hypothetical protein